MTQSSLRNILHEIVVVDLIVRDESYYAYAAIEVWQENTVTFHKEIWAEYRPYALAFTCDVLVTGSLWGLLVAFQWLTAFVPVKGKAPAVIDTIHSTGVIIIFGILAASLVWDVFQIKRQEYLRRRNHQ